MHHWLLPSLHVFIFLIAALLGALWAPWGWLVRRFRHSSSLRASDMTPQCRPTEGARMTSASSPFPLPGPGDMPLTSYPGTWSPEVASLE